MITKLARIANAALRERWSTVIIIALLLTAIRAVQDWSILATEPVTFFAKLFATLIISSIFSLAIHIVLYLLFSPNQHEEVPPAAPTPRAERAPAKRTKRKAPARRKKK